MSAVADTILEQLGGLRRLRLMTGADGFMHSENYLTFRLPARFARDGINCVKITLTPADTYTVAFLRIRGLSVVDVATYKNIYADSLRSLFAEVTGLTLEPPRIARGGAANG